MGVGEEISRGEGLWVRVVGFGICLEVSDEVGFAVLEAEFSADVFAVSADGGFGDAA